MNLLEIFLLLSGFDGMLVHHRVTPSIKFTGTHLYTWVERGTVALVLPKKITQCPRLGLEPRLLDMEANALTMRPPHLHKDLPIWAGKLSSKHVILLVEKCFGFITNSVVICCNMLHRLGLLSFCNMLLQIATEAVMYSMALSSLQIVRQFVRKCCS